MEYDDDEMTIRTNISLNKYADAPTFITVDEPNITESYQDQVISGKVFDTTSDYRSKIVQDKLKLYNERRKQLMLNDDATGTYEEQLAHGLNGIGANALISGEHMKKLVSKQNKIRIDDSK
jgi:hypothetical protein